MWTGYTPAIHRQSTSSPTSGNISPTSTYPPEVYQPRTPPPPPRQNHRKSLSRVEETIMEDDLVARDYALSTRQVQAGGGGAEGQGMDTGTESDEGSSFRTISPRRVGSTSPDHEEAGGGEEFVPPKSIHDDYLSMYIQPIRPRPGSSKLDDSTTTPGRPAPLRSTSTPAHNILTSPISLTSKPSVVPLRGLGFTPIDPDPADHKGEGSGRGRGKPIFEIFNAELSQGSEGMVRALKGHLEEVLRVQEEIGRMHLELEGLGDGVGDERRGSGMSGLGQGDGDGEGGEEGDGGSPSKGRPKSKEGEKEEGGEDKGDGVEKVETVLDKREKGVDELMERLSTLSNNLRTYHELGTPKLSFSHSHSRPQSKTNTLDPLSPPQPQMNRQHSAQADLLTFTTSPTPISPSLSPPRAEVGRSLPMRNPVAVHKGIDDLRRQEGLPSRRSTLNQSHISRSPQAQEEGGYKKDSDLAPLRLSIDENGEDGAIKKKQSTSFWDLEGLKKGNGTDGWVEHEHGQGHEYDHDHGLAPDEFPSPRPGRSGTGRGKKFDSPIEMVDRTRPW